MDYFPESHNVYLQALTLRKNATAFWLNIILLQRDLLIKK